MRIIGGAIILVMQCGCMLSVPEWSIKIKRKIIQAVTETVQAV